MVIFFLFFVFVFVFVFVFFLCFTFLFIKVLQVKMCCQNTKMACNKNVQNSASRDLKRTNCTINLQLVFTILVYMVSVDSLKVFSLQNLECFIFTCRKIACDLTYVQMFGPGKKVGFVVLLLEIKTKYLNTI